MSVKMLGVMIKQNKKNNFVKEVSGDKKATYQKNPITEQNLKTSKWDTEHRQRMCALTK